jgi:hypothetical protein
MRARRSIQWKGNLSARYMHSNLVLCSRQRKPHAFFSCKERPPRQSLDQIGQLDGAQCPVRILRFRKAPSLRNERHGASAFTTDPLQHRKIVSRANPTRLEPRGASWSAVPPHRFRMCAIADGTLDRRRAFAPPAKRQRAAALQNLAEARRASNRAKRLGVRCPRTAFGCVRLPKEHSIVAERSHPLQSGRGLPHSKTWRKHDAPRTARSVLECGAPAPLWIAHH